MQCRLYPICVPALQNKKNPGTYTVFTHMLLLRSNLGDRRDINKPLTILFKYQDGRKARVLCILVVVVKRDSAAFCETVEKI